MLKEQLAREWMRDHPAEALRALLYDVCGECKSSPVKGRVWRSINTPMDAHYYPCPVCGGSGRVPKDGAFSVEVVTPSTPDVGPHGEPIQPYPWLTADGGRIEPTRCTLRDGTYWIISASMLEGESE